MDFWSPLPIMLSLVGIANILLGIVIVAVRPYRIAHIWASLLAFSCGFWCMGIAGFLSLSAFHPEATLVVRSYYLAAATIAFALLSFSLTFPLPLRRAALWQTGLGAVYLGIVGLVVWSDLVRGVMVGPDGVNIAMLSGWEYGLYVLYFVLYSVSAIGLLSYRYLRARRSRQRRIAAQLYGVLRGVLVALFFGMIFNLILPLLGNYTLIWVGPPFTLLFVAAMLHSIIRHGLFDVRLAVMRTVAYSLTIVTLVGVYIGVIYIVNTTLLNDQSGMGMYLSIVHIIITLLLAVILQPITRFFNKITDAIFFRNEYTLDEFIPVFSGVLRSTVRLHEMLQRAAKEIAKAVKAEVVAFYVPFGDGKHTLVGNETKHQIHLPAADIAYLDRYVAEQGAALVLTRDLPAGHLHRMLISHNIHMLLPLELSNNMTAYCMVGERKQGEYSARDTYMVGVVADELAIAIQNSLLVHEVQDMNEHLQQRVDYATAELRRKNATLKRLDGTKDEFLSIASHQLRTPLTSIKGYLSMVLEGDAGKLNDMQRKLLSEAFESSERMVHLIHDFLNVSRLQTGKFTIERDTCDLVALVRGEVGNLQQAAKSRGVKLALKTNVNRLPLNIDETKFRQVVMNFIDNALYYTPSDTKAPVTVEIVHKPSSVEVTVTDSGIGVPKAEQARLFSKFYRASNARTKRPDGTGVGLFLAKKVVDGHGGNVIFSSREGKGSTFGFRLPLKENTPAK